MKYYVIIIKDDSEAIFKYETKNSALSKLHEEMKYALDMDINTSVCVTDKYFTQIKKEVYLKPVEVVEEEIAEIEMRK